MRHKLLFAVFLAVFAWGWPQPAQAHSQPAGTVKLAYTAIPGASATALGSYTFVAPASGAPGGRLISETSGASQSVPPPPACSDEGSIAGGGGYLAVGCASTADLYRVPAGPWTSVALPTSCAAANEGQIGSSRCLVTDVGSYWLRLDASCYHCATITSFERLSDGSVSALTPTPASVPDLDEPGLARPVCKPLSIPPNATVLFGRGFIVQSEAGNLIVRRCGASTPLLTTERGSLFSAEGKLVLWSPNATRLDAVCVPSKTVRRFTIPARISAVTGVTLTARHIYVQGQTLLGETALMRARRPSCG